MDLSALWQDLANCVNCENPWNSCWQVVATFIPILWDLFWQAAVVIIAYYSVRIAHAQYLANKEKLKLDLFEKRYSIFNAAKFLCVHIMRTAEVSSKEITKYRVDTADAEFLFENDVIDCLNEIDQKACDLLCLLNENERLQNTENLKEQGEWARATRECLLWFGKEALQKLKNALIPYMKFKK